jgi:hypothetical protein
MIREIVERIIGKWREKEKDDSTAALSLNKESLERLGRLRERITTLDTPELVALSLKCLEQKTDRIIKRQVKKKARTLQKEGLSFKQIADHLNDEGVPAVMEKDKWHAEDISRLVDKLNQWDFDDTVKDSHTRNGQSLKSYDM